MSAWRAFAEMPWSAWGCWLWPHTQCSSASCTCRNSELVCSTPHTPCLGQGKCVWVDEKFWGALAFWRVSTNISVGATLCRITRGRSNGRRFSLLELLMVHLMLRHVRPMLAGQNVMVSTAAGKHGNCGIHQSPGWAALSEALSPDEGSAAVGGTPPHLAQSDVYGRSAEQGGRHAVEGPPVSQRMAPPPTSGGRSLAAVQKGTGGSLCLPRDDTLPAVALSGRGRCLSCLILIAPHWPSRAWFPELIAPLHGEPW